MKKCAWIPLVLLTLISVSYANVHAAPTVNITSPPPTQQGASATYQITLISGTPGATYSLTLTGLPPGSEYSFSPSTIASGGSSVLVIRSAILTSLYCPGNYQFNVTTTNTLVNSDYASAISTFVVAQSTPPLIAAVSTDKSAYVRGENVMISIAKNTAAKGTLTISPPVGPPIVREYQFTDASNFVMTLPLNSTSPLGGWTIAFSAYDYCSSLHSDSNAQFEVIPLVTTTATETATATYSYTTTSTITTGSTTILVSTSYETGNLTVTNTSTTTSVASTSITTTTTLPRNMTTATFIVWKIENLPAEILLATILILSIASLVGRARRGHGKGIVCGKCGFRNPPTATAYCINCGERLKSA